MIKKIPEGGFVGQIKEVPGVLSQGKTVNELIENIVDALKLFMAGRLPDSWRLKKIFLTTEQFE